MYQRTRHITRLLGCALLAGAWLGIAPFRADAAPPASLHPVPHYYVLGRVPHGDLHGKGRGYTPAAVSEVRRTPYAYGWFGAVSRRHWVRHEGYRRNYVQWRTK